MALIWMKTAEGYEAKANGGTDTWTARRVHGRFVLELNGDIRWGAGSLHDAKQYAQEDTDRT